MSPGFTPRQLAFLTFDREVEQYLCAAVLRPGNAVASDGDGPAARLLPLLRAAFPRARFLVLDGGRPRSSSTSAEPRLDYVVAIGVGAARRAGHGGRAGAE